MCTASLFYNIEFPSVLSKEDRSDKQQLPCGKKKKYAKHIFALFPMCLIFITIWFAKFVSNMGLEL